MKRLFYSSFAVSLFILAIQSWANDDFELLDAVSPVRQGAQKFTPLNFHQKEEWNVSEKMVEIDNGPFKGQSHSIIPWATLNSEEWLDINNWINERDIKDKNPEWKIRIRQDRHLELVGKMIRCQGECRIFRGTDPINGQYLSRLLEGDEVTTGKNSVAWIYLLDGTLLRVGPSSSVSLQEINWAKAEVFFLIRLNGGHLNLHSRSKESLTPDYAPETDQLILPLMIKEANQEYFERILAEKQKNMVIKSELLSLEEEAIKNQYNKINELKIQNGTMEDITSKFMVVSPNATLFSSQVSFDLVYLAGSEGYFKKRGASLGEEFSLQLRGHTDSTIYPIESTSWHQVTQLGRGYEQLNDVPYQLQVMELLTKRIKSLELVREIWIKEFTLPIIADLSNEKNLAEVHGHVLWGDELKQRKEYLTEYSRRTETTNLRSLTNLIEKLNNAGEKVSNNLSEIYFGESLNHYLKSIKGRYTDTKIQVRDMSDLQYYVWVLRNGKI